MLFNSFNFLIFFPVVTAVYFLLAHRFRWCWLLFASAVFYMAFIPKYLLILGVLILIDYAAGLAIERASPKRKRFFLIISILSNIGLLGFFKYYNFAAENITILADFLHWNYSLGALSFILPLGLSFHTFQALSYTIEVYRGRQKAERHLGIYALYVMFYPQLVAGPIERPGHMLHQFYEKHAFSYSDAVSGLRLMLFGFFKKVVVADRAAVFVDAFFNNPTEYHGISVVIVAMLFSIQIFCDFSGYSDIAIGAARVMGFKLVANFNQPYVSRSISEFWRRWHISLSSWFRDYLYIPLGGNRVPKARRYFNIFIVFLVSGLWHGASWTFVIWGALHGVYQLFSLLTVRARERCIWFMTFSPRALSLWKTAVTFSLVSFAWIFFRAPSLSEAFLIIRQLVTGWGSLIVEVSEGTFFYHAILLNQPLTQGVILLCVIALLELVQYLQRSGKTGFFFAQPTALRWCSYSFVLWLIVFFGQFGGKQFLYFVF